MRFTFRAALFALALTLSVLRCPSLQAQEPPPPASPVSPAPVPADAPAAVAPQDVPPPNPGQVVRPWQPGDPEPKGPLQIVVIEGQDGVNILKKKRAVQPVLEVRDGHNTPIAGASITVSSPTDGPSVTFSNGLRSISVVTDATGRATVEDLKPMGEGQFQLTLESSFRSLSATGNISMTNALKSQPKTAAAGTTGAAKAGMSGKTIAILVGVGVAAAAGIGVGLSGHSSSASSSSSTSTTATIGAGSGGSVGAPH